MYFFLKFYFDFIKLYSIIIVFLTLFLLLFNICFPHEVFAMEPSKDIVEDYYGNKEYIGKDSYGHFNPSGSSNNYPNSVQPDLKPPYSPQLGPSKPVVSEDDIGFSSHNSVFSLYLTMKRKTYWYIWKIHTAEYDNYKDFKQVWDPTNSIRKDFVNDIKSVFKRK